MNSPYSILVLRGSHMRRFVVAPQRLRELLWLGMLVVLFAGFVLDRHLKGQRSKSDEVIANRQAQIERLSENLTLLRERTNEVQETLARWKGLRERIQRSLPPRSRRTPEPSHEVDELHEILAALQSELKQMIAALPLAWPVKGRVSSSVGMRPSPWTGEMEYHAGLDIPNPIGAPVHASGDATVESIDPARGTIVLNHSQQIKTRYAHLSKILVGRGERVRKGQIIGQVGNKGKSTGPHLHYEVRVAGIPIDPRKNLLSARHDE